MFKPPHNQVLTFHVPGTTSSEMELAEHLGHYLRPPGRGVHTISSGAQYRRLLEQSYPGDFEKSWRSNLANLQQSDAPLLLGIPSDCGGGILRGAAWGPLFLRLALLENPPSFVDLGDVFVVPHLLHDKYLNEATLRSCRQALYRDPQSSLPVSPLSVAQDALENIYRKAPDKKVFAVGGDHSCSYPAVLSFLEHKKRQGKRIALIHFDAHTDLLDERLGIDLCFGTWTRHVLNALPSPRHCIQLGIRATGKTQEAWESTLKVKQYWAKDILADRKKIWDDLRTHLGAMSADELYITFDIDALDASHAPCTGTPESQGLSPEDCQFLIERLAARYPVTGADIMEIAPLTGAGEEGRKITLESSAAIARLLIDTLS